jgi:hypothetical protein
MTRTLTLTPLQGQFKHGTVPPGSSETRLGRPVQNDMLMGADDELRGLIS